MSLRKRTPIIAVFIAIIFSLVLISPLSTAQQPGQNSGSGLQLSPTRSDLSGQPGEKKNFSIILRNITQTDLTAQVFLNDFQSDNSSGTPQIIVDSNQRTPYTLAKMLRNFTDVDLKAGETKEIKLQIDIPGNTPPGAYFGALRYAAVPKGRTQSQAERQVALTASVAHLVFVEVPGDVREQIQVESLKAQRNGKGGSFFFQAPNETALGVKNLGNGFSRPFGKVVLSGPFGGEVHSYDVNNTDPRGIILPDSSRVFTDQIKGVKLPGKYNITASVAYGNGGEVVSYKTSFLYMPLWAIVVLLVLIVLIAGGGYYTYRKRFGKRSSSRR